MTDHVGFLPPSAGEVDVQMLTELQSELPDLPIKVEIVEGSDELIGYFRGSDPSRCLKQGKASHFLPLVTTGPSHLAVNIKKRLYHWKEKWPQ